MAQVAPSILNSNLLHLEVEVQKIHNADWLHFDVMDGHFVPNLTFGPMFVSSIKTITNLPIEAHLMVNNPEYFIPLYIQAGCKRVIIHPEGVLHLHRLVQTIKENGCQVGVALNPATPLNILEHVLFELDLVLIMSVNPGFGGQTLIPEAIQKIKNLSAIIQEKHLKCLIEVDGGVNWENAPRLVEAGVDILVAGTLIYKNPDPSGAVERLRNITTKGGNPTVI